MQMTRDLQRIKQRSVPILRRYKVPRAAIFGSFARGEQRKKSDVDMLIEPPKGIGLFDFAGLKLDLEERLGRKVDLVSYHGIHPALKRRILQEQISIYEKKS